LHGAQRVRDSNGAPIQDLTPTTYYHATSPMAKMVTFARANITDKTRQGRFGVVGLGTGALSCFSRQGEHWRFFEIDPLIVKIASSPKNFSYLQNCLPSLDVVIGDARLQIAKEPNNRYDLLIVDAFSSDAVPLHLITAEALRMYAEKLTPAGVLVLHISNRYLDLKSVVAATAKLVPELKGYLIDDVSPEDGYAVTNSTIAVFTKSDAVFDKLWDFEGIESLKPGSIKAWTDDYSDIIAPLIAKWKE
jgi:spermidine synthase